MRLHHFLNSKTNTGASNNTPLYPLMNPLRIAFCLCLTVGLEAKTPNLLFIAIDDLNDWVGCMGGHPQARRPILTVWQSVELCF